MRAPGQDQNPANTTFSAPLNVASVGAAVGMMGILVCLASSPHAAAQELYVSHASERGTTGGVAGRAGTNYQITLVSAYPPATVQIRGIWIDERYVAFEPGAERPYHLPANISYTQRDNLTHYSINCGIDRSSYPGLQLKREQNAAQAPVKPRPAVKARGVLDVFVTDEQRYVPITDFERLPAVNYP